MPEFAICIGGPEHGKKFEIRGNTLICRIRDEVPAKLGIHQFDPNELADYTAIKNTHYVLKRFSSGDYARGSFEEWVWVHCDKDEDEALAEWSHARRFERRPRLARIVRFKNLMPDELLEAFAKE